MRECFVIMPIGTGDAYQVYRNRYEHIIQPAVDGLRVSGEQVFRCVRADFVAKTGSITRDLLGRLYRSDAVIADLTDLNPNVFYELGVRHALRAGTILVALKGTRPPFDVGDLRLIPFEDRVGGEKEAIPEIQKMLLSLLEDERPQDSPVLHAIPELAQMGALKEQEARVAALASERDRFRAQLEISERMALDNQAAIKGMQATIENLINRLSPPQRPDARADIEAAILSTGPVSPETRPAGVSDLAADPELVFVLTPPSPDFKSVFDAIRTAADRMQLRTVRPDPFAQGPIIDQIFDVLSKCGLVVVDATGGDPNVLYVLGLAQSLNKQIVLLSQDSSDLRFAFPGFLVFVYDPSPVGMHELLSRLSHRFLEYKDSIRESRRSVRKP
jgi:hypothetical protein